jgi:hypothetical protein
MTAQLYAPAILSWKKQPTVSTEYEAVKWRFYELLSSVLLNIIIKILISWKQEWARQCQTSLKKQNSLLLITQQTKVDDGTITYLKPANHLAMLHSDISCTQPAVLNSAYGLRIAVFCVCVCVCVCFFFFWGRGLRNFRHFVQGILQIDWYNLCYTKCSERIRGVKNEQNSKLRK